ncbi:MAG: hypothetical protein V4747_13430 [Pseudomonadota bacterium]
MMFRRTEIAADAAETARLAALTPPVRALTADRPLPFAPAGRAMPLFFLHIPRTSGGSLVSRLRQLYGDDNVTAQAQDRVMSVALRKSGTMATDCVAGTIPLIRWELYQGTALYRRITLLRDPWARLVSHINWVDRFNNGTPYPDDPAQAAALRSMAEAVGRTDFASRTSLARFCRLAKQVEGGFDNLQVRMLLTGSMAAMVKPLFPRDVDKALQNLEAFAMVGFCEDQSTIQRKLSGLVGLPARREVLFENAGKGQTLTLRNDLAREVLEPWFVADLELYNRAKALAGLV